MLIRSEAGLSRVFDYWPTLSGFSLSSWRVFLSTWAMGKEQKTGVEGGGGNVSLAKHVFLASLSVHACVVCSSGQNRVDGWSRG